MIEESFEHEFGSNPEYKVFAPSRVNLIGDHTDYCGGECMPFATSNGTELWFSPNDSGFLEVYTDRFKERHSFGLKLEKERKAQRKLEQEDLIRRRKNAGYGVAILVDKRY